MGKIRTIGKNLGHKQRPSIPGTVYYYYYYCCLFLYCYYCNTPSNTSVLLLYCCCTTTVLLLCYYYDAHFRQWWPKHISAPCLISFRLRFRLGFPFRLHFPLWFRLRFFVHSPFWFPLPWALSFRLPFVWGLLCCLHSKSNYDANLTRHTGC